jgi:DNA-binding transcriptional LysR family regulator
VPLPEPCPDLVSLDLLVSVGELGSISAAAASHRMTQPAASMRLRDLEKLLGIPLLERATTGARLTPAGAATAEWANAALNAVRTLLSGTTALRADQNSHLQLAASLTVAEYLIPSWLRQLAADIPETKVSLKMGNSAHVIDLISHGEVELGFIEGSRPPRRLRFRELLTDELIVVVAPGHPWSRRRRPVAPGELSVTPLVLREVGSGTRDVLTEALGAHDLGVTAAMELGSTTAIKAATTNGVGPTVISARAVRHELGEGQLVSVPSEALSLYRTIRAVWAPSRPPSTAGSRLIDIAARTDSLS